MANLGWPVFGHLPGRWSLVGAALVRAVGALAALRAGEAQPEP